MQTISATDVALREARERGTLTVERHFSDRFGEPYWALTDEFGTIEVHLSRDDAMSRFQA